METLRVIGANQHNLKNVSCDIPRNALVVITGPSGSGKSSLAFDTIYAEGQRLYVESLSARARQHLEQLPRPAVEAILGLSPTISVEQRSTTSNPRSTVGTVTEIADALRVLFAKVGVAHCPVSGRPLQARTAEEMVDELLRLPEGTRFVLLAPLGRALPGDLQPELAQLRRQGYLRARVDEHYVELASEPRFSAETAHRLEVVIDRLTARAGIDERLTDSLEHALARGNGTVLVDLLEVGEVRVMSERLISFEFGLELPPLEPRSFSFNSPQGACPRCEGLGVLGPHDDRVGDRDRDARETAEGAEGELSAVDPASLRPSLRCPACHGTRLRPEAHLVTVLDRTLPELCALPLVDLLPALNAMLGTLAGNAQEVARPLVAAATARLHGLLLLGLGYLTLERASNTLSSGESQRLRLASQLGSALTGVLYVLDEPSIGLHPRDTERMLEALRALVRRGNSVLMVEHDLELIRAADYVLDLGPGAGELGGHLVAKGTPAELLRASSSPTGPYLAGTKHLPRPARSEAPLSRMIRIEGARAHNLKDVTATFPVGALTVVSGVSGSGKSSLVVGTLLEAARRKVCGVALEHGPYDAVSGLDAIRRVVDVDSTPIGNTPRSNPATYSGLFTLLRELFSELPEARARGFKAGRFSFNVKGGRCERCRGDGVLAVEMHFLPNVYVTCDACRGQRYNRETLQVRYRGKNIADALALTVDEASDVFAALPKLAQRLRTLRELGLGYLRLGQPAPTLSGGEAQRLKLATELARPNHEPTLYVLDEPTTGLHFTDVELLLQALFALRDAGHTLVLIEHLPEVIACADWVIDLGPEGGDAGGQILSMGPPDVVATCRESHTARFLAKALWP